MRGARGVQECGPDKGCAVKGAVGGAVLGVQSDGGLARGAGWGAPMGCGVLRVSQGCGGWGAGGGGAGWCKRALLPRLPTAARLCPEPGRP